jgi:hypothetical protein
MLGDFKTDARTRNEFLHLARSAPYSHVAGPAEVTPVSLVAVHKAWR